MNFDTDTVLLFLAGMIIGGFVYVKAEAYLMERYYPGQEGEERLKALRKLGTRMTFAGVFFFVLSFFLFPSTVFLGVCAGFAIFGFKP